MATTTLLVELLIVGYAFFVSITPFISLIFKADIIDIFQFSASLEIHYQLIIAYGLGIIWNRACDQIFHIFDLKIIRTKFIDRESYQKSRIKLVMSGKEIYNYLSNFRSLIRITRVLSILFLILIFTTPFLYNYMLWVNFSNTQKFLITIFEIILFIFSCGSWYHLQKGYVSAIYDGMKIIYNNLRKHS